MLCLPYLAPYGTHTFFSTPSLRFSPDVLDTSFTALLVSEPNQIFHKKFTVYFARLMVSTDINQCDGECFS